VRRGPIIAGSIMFGATYLVNVLLASNYPDERATWLYIPGVGTWGIIGDECDRSRNDSTCEFLVLHSLTHTFGTGLLLYGLFAKKTVLMRDDAHLIVGPTRVGRGYGMAATGVF